MGPRKDACKQIAWSPHHLLVDNFAHFHITQGGFIFKGRSTNKKLTGFENGTKRS